MSVLPTVVHFLLKILKNSLNTYFARQIPEHCEQYDLTHNENQPLR